MASECVYIADLPYRAEVRHGVWVARRRRGHREHIHVGAVPYKARVRHGLWVAARSKPRRPLAGTSAILLTDDLAVAGLGAAAESNLGSWIERAGQSAVIDTMHSPGAMHIHRAWDSAHDPLFGFLVAARNGTLRKWGPHMAHDFLTPLSLPLPGVAHYETLRLAYIAGFNMRTVVAVPLLAVGVTEFLTWGQPPERKRTAHLINAGITGVLAAALLPFVAHTTVVALACTAVAHLVMALFHHFRRRRPKRRLTDVLWLPGRRLTIPERAAA